MEVVIDLLIQYSHDKATHSTQVKQFGLYDRVAGEKDENLQYILDSTGVVMSVQTQPTGMEDGLQFTLEHEDIDELKNAENLIFMLLIEIKDDFEAFMTELNINDVVKFKYKNNRAKCGICGKSRSSSMEDFIKHVKFHDKLTSPVDKTGTSKKETVNTANAYSQARAIEDTTTETQREKPSSPNHTKRRRSQSPSLSINNSQFSGDFRISPGPSKRQRMSPHHRNTSCDQEQYRERSRSKSGSSSRTYRSPPATLGHISSQESRENSLDRKHERSYVREVTRGKDREQELDQEKELDLEQETTVPQLPRAVRDLLDQGLGPRPSRYSNITDEMILYPHLSEPVFVAEIRKYTIMKGRFQLSINNKSAQTLWWLLTFKALTPDEKEVVEEKVRNSKCSASGVSHSEKLTLQLEFACDYLIDRCKSLEGREQKEPYPHRNHLKKGMESERAKHQIEKDLLAIKDNTSRDTTDLTIEPEPGEYDERFNEVSDSMIQNYHPAEPEFVALGRRYFLLLDRNHGRLKDAKTLKIIQALSSSFSSNEEKRINDMFINSCARLGNTYVLPKTQSLTMRLENLCDYLVSKARINSDPTKYPYLKRPKKDDISGRKNPTRIRASYQDRAVDKELTDHFTKIPDPPAETTTNMDKQGQWDISKNGQYHLDTDAQNVNVNAIIWIDCLREQNQINAVYTVTPWTDRTITLELGEETHTADAKGDKVSSKQLGIQLKQQVALDALMNTSYSFTKIPASLKKYVSNHICINEEGVVLSDEPLCDLPCPGEVTEEVTSTVVLDSAKSASGRQDNEASQDARATSEVIQSNDVSQSTDAVEENKHNKSFTLSEISTDIDIPSTAARDNEEDAGQMSNTETVIIKRNEIELKAKKYLKELQDSETDELTENTKRLAELEGTLTEQEKIKISKNVNKTMEELKKEVDWTVVPAEAEISAKLEITCKYILQRGTARQLVAAAKPKPAVKTVKQMSKTTTIKSTSAKSKNAAKTKSTPPKASAAGMTSKSEHEHKKEQHGKSKDQTPKPSQRKNRLIDRAKDYNRRQQDGKLTEKLEAKYFDILYKDLLSSERAIVDKKVEKELTAIRTEMGYFQVPRNVECDAQLEIVCRYILDEMDPDERCDPEPSQQEQTTCQIDLPWISDLEPLTSKNQSLKERLPVLEKHVRLTLETRKEGVLSDEDTKDKIKRIKKDMNVDYNEVNKRYQKYLIKRNISQSARITAHFNITCEYVLEKFREVLENSN